MSLAADGVSQPSPGLPSLLAAGGEALHPAQTARAALRVMRHRSRCPLVLADRNITPTVQRAWGSLTPWQRLKLVVSFGCSSINISGDAADELRDAAEGMKGGGSPGR